MYLGTQDKDFFPQQIEEKLAFVKSMGFSCFEIDGKLLMEQTEQVAQAVKNTGLPVLSACGGYRGWIGDFIEEKRLNGIEDLTNMIHCLRQVGGKGIVIPAAWGMFTYRLPPMVSPRSKEGDRQALLDSLSRLEPVAKACGITLYLEPLNRYQDHMLNTLEDGAGIIREGKFESVKLTADFYHMSIEEDDISAALTAHKELIGHVHIAENHRYQPGTGSIDFARHIKTLKEIGYEGAVVNEGRIRGENPLECYRASVAYMQPLMG